MNRFLIARLLRRDRPFWDGWIPAKVLHFHPDLRSLADRSLEYFRRHRHFSICFYNYPYGSTFLSDDSIPAGSDGYTVFILLP